MNSRINIHRYSKPSRVQRLVNYGNVHSKHVNVDIRGKETCLFILGLNIRNYEMNIQIYVEPKVQRMVKLFPVPTRLANVDILGKEI